MSKNRSPESINKHSLGLTDIPEGSFKHDLSITDRYQSFSAEILRLSLLGIAGIGFLLANVFIKDATNPSYQAFLNAPNIKWYLSASLVCLGVSAAFALLHRYFSTDSIGCQLRYIRLEKNGLKDKPAAKKEERCRDRGFTLSYWLLWGAASLLGAGAICLAISFISWLRAIRV